MNTETISNQPATGAAPAQMPFDDLLQQQPADGSLAIGGVPDYEGGGGSLSPEQFLIAGHVVLAASGKTHTSGTFNPGEKSKLEGSEIGIEYVRGTGAANNGPKIFARYPLKLGRSTDDPITWLPEAYASNPEMNQFIRQLLGNDIREPKVTGTGNHWAGVEVFTRLPVPGSNSNLATVAIGGHIRIGGKGWKHSIVDSNDGVPQVKSQPNGYFFTGDIGFYMKAIAPVTNNVATLAADAHWVPCMRIEFGGVGKNIGASSAALGGSIVFEANFIPEQLIYTPPTAPPSNPNDREWREVNGGGQGGRGRICYRVPGTDQLLDITMLAEPLLGDDFKAKIPTLANSGADAQYFDINGAPKVWSLDMDDLGDKLRTAIAPYIPEDLEEKTAAAMAYAPLATAALRHGDDAVRAAQIANALRTANGLNSIRAVVGKTGIGLLASEMIGDYVEDAYLSDAAMERMAAGGTLTPTRALYHSLADDMTMDQIGLADRINTNPVNLANQVEMRVKNGLLSYPEALDVVQQLEQYDDPTVQNIAPQIIQHQPALRYLDALEGYAVDHTQGQGITDFRGLNAAQIAQSLWQLSDEGQKPALAADLSNTFGLERMDDGNWWVTASEVDQGNGNPMKDQGKLWDKLAAMWRSEFKQKRIDQDRAVAVISAFAQDLGLHITPEVAAKIARQAGA